MLTVESSRFVVVLKVAAAQKTQPCLHPSLMIHTRVIYRVMLGLREEIPCTPCEAAALTASSGRAPNHDHICFMTHN